MDNLKTRIAEAIFQTLYPFSWRVVKDRTPEENLGAEVGEPVYAQEAYLWAFTLSSIWIKREQWLFT